MRRSDIKLQFEEFHLLSNTQTPVFPFDMYSIVLIRDWRFGFLTLLKLFWEDAQILEKDDKNLHQMSGLHTHFSMQNSKFQDQEPENLDLSDLHGWNLENLLDVLAIIRKDLHLSKVSCGYDFRNFLSMRGILETGKNMFSFQLREIIYDFFKGHTTRKPAQNISNSDPSPNDGRFSKSDFLIQSYKFRKIFHISKEFHLNKMSSHLSLQPQGANP